MTILGKIKRQSEEKSFARGGEGKICFTLATTPSQLS